MICQDEYDGADTGTETIEEEAIVAETDDAELLSEPSDSDATALPDDPLTVDIQGTDQEGRGSGVTVLFNDTCEWPVEGNGTDPGEEQGVCGIFMNRRWNQKVRNQELRKEDPYLDGSSTEKVPMPMFEEDVPSVLELEMEEMDQWMKKDVEPAEDSIHA